MPFSSKNSLSHIKKQNTQIFPNQVSHHSKYRQLFWHIFNSARILSLLSTLGFGLRIWTKSAKTPVFSRLLTFCPYYNSIVNTPYYPCCFHIYDPPYFCCTVIFSAMLQKICRNRMCVFAYSPSMRSYMLFYIYSTSFVLSRPQVILRFPFRQRRASRKSFGTLSPFKTIRYSSS